MRAEQAKYRVRSRQGILDFGSPAARRKAGTPTPRRKTHAAILLELHLAELGLTFEPEVMFAPPRKWRLDYLVSGRLAVEIEGGGWTGGRHTRGAGFAADLEKYATAVSMGLWVMRLSPQQILSGAAKDFLRAWQKSVPENTFRV
jgi:hypothetical protein